MDLQRAFNEANARLRGIQEQLCCNGNYNSLDVLTLDITETKVFAANTIHSLAWNLNSGASITVSTLHDATFTKEGSVEFSSTNADVITVTAVGGVVNLIWTY